MNLTTNMTRTAIAAALVAGTTTFATTSSATTVSVADGQSFCESQRRSAFGAADCDLGGNADFGNDASAAADLTFAGEGDINGYVADQGGIGNQQFGDFVTITLAQASDLVFSLVGAEAGFDARLTVDGSTVADVSVASQTASFMLAAGQYVFGINAVEPTDSATRVASSYNLNISAADVAAVPLPAGMVLMLTGLGGLAAVRRKRAA